ncbi:MAG: dUTP pyrophosphatase [Patescibacteria group bacterium]|nr:dUTP pyrophosphatase [Patescibacteria group bacterium]
MKIKIKKIHPDAIIPHHAHYNDAGMDLFTPEAFEMMPNERISIPIGVAIEIPDGYVGLMWDKSGLSHKYGIKTFGGVIDAGYRGELHVGLMNLSNKSFKFEKGHKVVQLLIQKVEYIEFEEAEELNSTDRGAGGFGSTGK